MGGTDDPSNIKELSIIDHAQAHYDLWKQHGKLEDKAAWLMLSKGAGAEDSIKELRLVGLIKWYKENKPKPRSAKSRLKQSRSNKGHPYYGGGRVKGQKMSKAFSQAVSKGKKGIKCPRVAEANKNRVWTLVMKAKHSEASKRRWAKYREIKSRGFLLTQDLK